MHSVGTATSIRINGGEHYNQLGYVENVIPNVTVAAKNPGTWANGINVAIIDGRADQILSGITTTGVSLGDTQRLLFLQELTKSVLMVAKLI